MNLIERDYMDQLVKLVLVDAFFIYLSQYRFKQQP